MSKQDRQGVRTFNDLEYRYQFNRSFAEIMGIATDARNSAFDARKTVDELDAVIEAELALKIGYDDNDQIVSMLNAAADIINIRGNRIIIESDKFTLDEDGSISARYGYFGYCTIGDTCEILGVLKGNTIASHTFHNLAGEISFSGNTDAYGYDNVWNTMWLRDKNDAEPDVTPMVAVQRDEYGTGNVYLAMSHEIERGAYVHLQDNIITLRATTGTDPEIKLYSRLISVWGDTDISGDVSVSGKLIAYDMDIVQEIQAIQSRLAELEGN
jgi:hypothetical protein